jgi:hypothetical protein
MLPTLVTPLSSASKKIAKKDSPDRTHTTDIDELIKRTPDVSPANTARNTEERMASNAKTISPSTFGTTTTLVKMKPSSTTIVGGVQRQTASNQIHLEN